MPASASARARIACAKAVERGVGLRAGVDDVEPERGRDLVVARASRVDLAADVAELPLDRRVHVLVGGIDLLDHRELLGHLRELGVVEDACGVQTLGVEQRALDVVREQLRVVRVQEVPDLGRELRLDAAGPEGHRDQPSSASSLRASVMSLIFTASWPIRSAAVNAVALRSMLSRSGL